MRTLSDELASLRANPLPPGMQQGRPRFIGDEDITIRVKECLGHSPTADPLEDMELLAKLAGLIFLVAVLPLLSLCCCCCCGGGGGGNVAKVQAEMERKFLDSERKLRDELTMLDRLKAEAEGQAREARASGDMAMMELDQLRYERSQNMTMIETLRRDAAQAHHDLTVAQELNAQLQRDLVAAKDDQSDLYRALQRENDTLSKEVEESKAAQAEHASQVEQLTAALADAKATENDLRKQKVGIVCSVCSFCRWRSASWVF